MHILPSSTAFRGGFQHELAVAPCLLNSSPRESTICSREEPSNEAFYSELDDSGCGIGAARAAGRQLGPADDPIDHTASADHRRAGAADGRTPVRTAAGVCERASASGAVGTGRYPRGVTDWHGEDQSRRAEAALERRSRSRRRRSRRRAAPRRGQGELEHRRRGGRSHPERAARSREHDRRDHTGPAGTTGSTATAPKTTTSGKPAASMTLDEAARAKLQEVRTHITAFAAAMSGASASSPASTPADHADASPSDPSASASAAPRAPRRRQPRPRATSDVATPTAPRRPRRSAADRRRRQRLLNRRLAATGAVSDSASGRDRHAVAHAVAAGRCRDGEAPPDRRARHAQPADAAARRRRS